MIPDPYVVKYFCWDTDAQSFSLTCTPRKDPPENVAEGILSYIGK